MAVDYKLEGHVAVITGSTSGIGQALATALAEQGVNVVLNGLGDPAKIEADRQALQARTNSAVRYHPADMTRPEEIKDLIAYAVREFGRLDILVNNAGIQHVAPVDEFPEEKWDALIAVILSATFHASRAAIPIMKAQGRGRIINIASAHGLVASPFKAPYVAAKFGVVGFTKGGPVRGWRLDRNLTTQGTFPKKVPCHARYLAIDTSSSEGGICLARSRTGSAEEGGPGAMRPGPALPRRCLRL